MHTSDFSANLIASENIPLLWVIVKGRLERALEEFGEGEYGVDDLYASLLGKRAQLWIVNTEKFDIKLIGITRILSYPKRKRLLIDLVVGEDIKHVLSVLEQVTEWARHFQATQIEVHARPGLAKLLQREAAFKRNRVVLFRDIENADISETQRKMEQRQA